MIKNLKSIICCCAILSMQLTAAYANQPTEINNNLPAPEYHPISQTKITKKSAISLPEAIAYAIKNNPKINASRARLNAFKHDVRVQVGHFLPKIGVYLSQGIQTNHAPTLINAGLSEKDLYPEQSSINLEQIVYDGGKNTSQKHMYDALTQSALYNLADVEQKVIIATIQAYLQVEMSNQIIKYRKNKLVALKNLKYKTQYAKINYKQRSNLLKLISANILSARIDYHKIQADNKSAKINFLTITNLYPKYLKIARLPKMNFSSDVQNYVIEAYKNNPQILEQIARVKAAKQRINAAKANFYPKLGINVGYSYGHDIQLISGKQQDFEANAAISYNLFNGGSDSAKVMAQENITSVAQAKLVQKYREVRQNVENNWLTIYSNQTNKVDLTNYINFTSKAYALSLSKASSSSAYLSNALAMLNKKYSAKENLLKLKYQSVIAYYKILAEQGKLATV